MGAMERWPGHRRTTIRELWLFGSRSSGAAKASTDVDIGLVLMPAKGKHDWALGNYAALDLAGGLTLRRLWAVMSAWCRWSPATRAT